MRLGLWGPYEGPHRTLSILKTRKASKDSKQGSDKIMYVL